MAARRRSTVTRRRRTTSQATQPRTRRKRTTRRRPLFRFTVPDIRLTPSRAFLVLGLLMVVWQFVVRASAGKSTPWISADAAGVAGIMFLLLAGLSFVLEISGLRDD